MNLIKKIYYEKYTKKSYSISNVDLIIDRIFASKDNNIAIWQTNELIPKWDLQGRFIMDGTNLSHDWKPPIPIEHRPYSLNPKRGFLSSANQNPVDLSYPYFVPGDYAPPFRGARIDELLADIDNGTYNDLQKIQNDNKSLLAELLLPQLLKAIDSNLNYVYLGYWISGCSKMSYKSNFSGLEKLINNTWLDF